MSSSGSGDAFDPTPARTAGSFAASLLNMAALPPDMTASASMRLIIMMPTPSKKPTASGVR